MPVSYVFEQKTYKFMVEFVQYICATTLPVTTVSMIACTY